MFTRRWIINYVLVVLIVVFTYVGNRFAGTTDDQPQQRISGLKSADIDSVEIQTANALLTLQRDAGGWLLESPIHWPANSINIERVLSIVNSAANSRLPADEINLATFGLQFPQTTLRFNDTQLLFGATNNIGDRRYIMVDSAVFLLPDVYLPFFSQGLVSIIDRRLLPPRYKLSKLKLPEFEISRDLNDHWQALSADTPGPDQISGLVANWQNLEASQIKLFNASLTPRHKLLIELQDGSKLEFLVMALEPEIVIAHPGIGLQYHFPADLYYQLISLRAHETPG
jgi:hypothetical protein